MGIGYSSKHDDGHRAGEVGRAGHAYLTTAAAQAWMNGKDGLPAHSSRPVPGTFIPPEWPWSSGEYKPSPDPLRNMVKGMALCAAELDRLARLRGLPWDGIGTREVLASIMADPRVEIPEDLRAAAVKVLRIPQL